MVTIVISLVIIIAKKVYATGTVHVYHVMLAGLVQNADLYAQWRFLLVQSAMVKMLMQQYVQSVIRENMF